MPHINTMPGGHDGTMSAFIIRLDTPEPMAVMHRHKLLGKYLQFGGHIEPTENPWQTMVHELLEESGYGIDQLRIMQPKVRIKKLGNAVLHPLPFCKNTHSFPNGHFHYDDSLLFVTSEVPRHKPEDGEMTDIRLFSRQQIIDMDPKLAMGNVNDIFLAAFDLFLAEYEEVPTSEFQLA